MIAPVSRRRRVRCARARLLCALALVLPAALLAACGGDDSLAKGPPGSASNPLVAHPNPTKTGTPSTPDPEEAEETPRRPGGSIASRQRAAQRAADKRRAAAKAHSKPAATASPTRPSQARRTLPTTTPVSARRPCTLVTKSQAQALIGAPILEPLQAPQGPTCIYRSRSGKSFVTLAVQTVSFMKLRSQMRHRRRIEVSDRTGYCGNLGQPELYVALSAGRVLRVAAPCSLASRFAAKAIPMLPA